MGEKHPSWFDDSQLSEQELSEYLAKNVDICVDQSNDDGGSGRICKLMEISHLSYNFNVLEGSLREPQRDHKSPRNLTNGRISQGKESSRPSKRDSRKGKGRSGQNLRGSLLNGQRKPDMPGSREDGLRPLNGKLEMSPNERFDNFSQMNGRMNITPISTSNDVRECLGERSPNDSSIVSKMFTERSSYSPGSKSEESLSRGDSVDDFSSRRSERRRGKGERRSDLPWRRNSEHAEFSNNVVHSSNDGEHSMASTFDSPVVHPMMRFQETPIYMDTHCHIDFILRQVNETSWDEFSQRFVAHIPQNFFGAIQVFCDPDRFSPNDPIVRMLQEDRRFWFAFGCHPKRVCLFSEAKLAQLRQCLDLPRVKALGEVGLDYSKEFFKQARQQQEALRQQLAVAVATGMPVVLHCRETDRHGHRRMDADDDLIRIVKEELPADHRIHLHSFNRNWRRAERWLAAFPNLVLGITCAVTDPNSERLHEVARRVPLDRLVIETDSPFFVPAEISKSQSPCSLPWFSIFAAERIAQLRGLSLEMVLCVTFWNAQKMYGISLSEFLSSS